MKDRIFLLRKELGLSQAAFAESVKLSRNFLSLVEKGERNLSNRTISDICQVHNVNETWLRTGEGEMIKEKTREQEIAELVLSLARSPEDSFTMKLAELLPKLNEEQLEALYNMAKVLEKKDVF